MTEYSPLNLRADLDLEPPDKMILNFAQRQGDKISSQGIALLGLLGFLGACLIMGLLQLRQPSQLILEFGLLTALPMVLANIVINKTYLRLSNGLSTVPKSINWQRVRIKWIGFSGTIFVLAFLYWVIPEYSRAYYRPVWEMMVWLALPILLLSFPYILWVDARMRDPEDGYWHAGLLILGKWCEINREELHGYALGWLVKGFFLPFMLGGAAERLTVLCAERLNFSTFGHFYVSSINVAYTIDVLFGGLGYLLTLRIMDSHIQSVERTLLGWLCTICCYVPFSTIIWSTVLSYKGKTNWADWLGHQPVILITWGFAIMVLHGVYVWSTCSFGCRFSNLTNRGIIVDGPYRYLKHPAYLSKNLAWWLMSVPFVAHQGFLDATRACSCLLLTNGIYFIRAWTEERHLLRDPAYQAYCAWMEEHGLGSQLRALWKNIYLIPRKKSGV